MIVIYGNRWYGQAYSHLGAGLATRGFHMYYLPLIPAGQMWVTHRAGNQIYGMKTRWSWRAAAPIFAFQWAVIAALVFGSGSPVAGAIAALALVAFGVWALATNPHRGERAERARNLLHGVIGTGCPPELITRDSLRQLAPRLDAAWGQVSPDRSPEDVASRGPRDHREGAYAYALLTVRGHLESGELGKTLRTQATQVFDAMEKAPALPEGAPYRADVQLPESTG